MRCFQMSKNQDTNKVYTREELASKLADAIIASSEIEVLTEVIKAMDEGRLSQNGEKPENISGTDKLTPYGRIYHKTIRK